jgi:hypothetical protein
MDNNPKRIAFSRVHKIRPNRVEQLISFYGHQFLAKTNKLK